VTRKQAADAVARQAIAMPGTFFYLLRHPTKRGSYFCAIETDAEKLLALGYRKEGALRMTVHDGQEEIRP
jgi:hypothetical protein